MPRLIDTLLRAKLDAQMQLTLAKSTVVKADNVLTYLEETGKPADMEMVRNLPHVIPPLGDMLVEFNIPRVGAIGWLLHAFDLKKESPKAEFTVSEARWMIRAYFFVEFAPHRPQMDASYYVNEDGSLHRITDGENAVEYYMRPTVGSIYKKAWDDEPYGQWMYAPVMSLNVALWTICFMHAKNAIIEAVDAPEKLSKRAVKDYGVPIMRYHVLKIRPMGRVSKDDKGGTHKAHALHIRRGHFKTFTVDKPLFGSHIGTYWWQQAIVGNEKEGVVLKDYEVETE